ncbi:MAG: hypothetical protein JWR33_136 [Naasia sp.]|jgi:hypothetical protein|nr:hypothetical protein [Naasia sp.]
MHGEGVEHVHESVPAADVAGHDDVEKGAPVVDGHGPHGYAGQHLSEDVARVARRGRLGRRRRR